MKSPSTHHHAGALFNPFLPVVLIALAAMLTIGLQTKNEISRRSTLNLALEQRSMIAKQGEKVRPQLDKLATDLYKLSQTDATARAIVRKYRIQVGNKGGQTAQQP